MAEWTHNGLAHDLANHLRGNPGRMVWEDMPMGPSGSVRPDVFTMFKSYSKPRPMVYEVKVSRADFRSDITSGKWHGYTEFAGAVLFAVPKGLVKKSEIPAGCGMIVRSDKVWRTVKGPTIGRSRLSEDILLKLLINGVDRLQKTIGPRQVEIWNTAWLTRHGLGKDVAEAVYDLVRARKRAAEINANAAKIKADAERDRESLLAHLDENTEAIRKQIAVALGRSEGAALADLARNFEEYMAKRLKTLAADSEVERLTEIIDRITSNVETAGKIPSEPYWRR